METYVVRLWLDDEPGMLGRVATQIGVLGADVVGIDILERDGGQAVDDLAISLAPGLTIETVLGSLSSIPGVGVEDARPIAGDRPEATIMVLDAASRIVEFDGPKRLDGVARELLELFDGTWVTVLAVDDDTPLLELGEGPDLAWLGAFIAGSAHLDPWSRAARGPSDLMWAGLDAIGAVIAVGRGSAFRSRERRQLMLLSRIVSGLLVLDPPS